MTKHKQSNILYSREYINSHKKEPSCCNSLTQVLDRNASDYHTLRVYQMLLCFQIINRKQRGYFIMSNTIKVNNEEKTVLSYGEVTEQSQFYSDQLLELSESKESNSFVYLYEFSRNILVKQWWTIDFELIKEQIVLVESQS